MEFRPIATMIKDVLKKRGLTYKDLGKHLELTESGVKKLLNSQDCSINRLTGIADFLGMNLSDLLSLIEQHRDVNIMLPQEAQDYFLENPEPFFIYMSILYDESSVSEIQQRHGIDLSATYHNLKILDDFGLIKWDKDDSIKPKHEVGLLDGDRNFIEHMKRVLATMIFEESMEIHSNNHPLFLVRYLYASEDTFAKFSQELNDTIMKFERLALRDQRLYGKKTLAPRKFFAISANGRLKFKE